MGSFLNALWDGNVDAVREFLKSEPALANSTQEELPPLSWACQQDNVEILRALLEFGADPNLAAEDGETPLHIAAFQGSEPCVQLLLDNGADVNAEDEDGKTPLMNAVRAGLPITRSLLRAGADPRKKDNGERTALHWATLGNHDDGSLIRLLLSAGADPQVKNLNGDTALDYARAMNKRETERALSGR
jgi:uncharacterized protein